MGTPWVTVEYPPFQQIFPYSDIYFISPGQHVKIHGYIYYPNPWWMTVTSSRFSWSYSLCLSEIVLLLPHWDYVETPSGDWATSSWGGWSHILRRVSIISYGSFSVEGSEWSLDKQRLFSTKGRRSVFCHSEASRGTTRFTVLRPVYSTQGPTFSLSDI